MSSDQKPCVLCRTPISPTTAAGDEGEFCCTGCEKVYEVLTHLDADAQAAYVETARRMGLIPADPNAEPMPPERAKKTPPAESLRTERLQAVGLVCPSCSWVSQEVLDSCNGVVDAKVSYFTQTVELTYDMSETDPDRLDDILKPLGYGLAPLADEGRSEASRRAVFQFVITAILTMNVMSLSVLRYFHTLGYLESLPPFLAVLEGALVLPVLYIGWLPTVRRALLALRYGRPTMDLLIAVGVFAAALLSAVSLAHGKEDLYFETCAGLVTISLLSRMIETRLRDRAFSSLSRLMKMPVVRVRRIQPGGATEYAELAAVNKGDLLSFDNGELVPVDGHVAERSAVVSEAQLTGEPTPIDKQPGDGIVAGSAVLEGPLTLRVERRFDETLLSKIAQNVGEVLSNRESHLRQADRIAAYFIPAVLAVAAASWLVRAGLFGWAVALSPAGWFPSVAVLAVACPCAFSLAGISAVTAAVGALLKQGYLVNDIDILQQISGVDYAIFDKTGTLTQGVMTVERLVLKDDTETGRNDAPLRQAERADAPLRQVGRVDALLAAVLAAENHAVHPTAEAIRGHLIQLGISPSTASVSEAVDLPGRGRTAVVGGNLISIGSADLFDAPFVPDGLSDRATAIWFGWGREASGCFLLFDPVKPHAADAVSGLKELRIDCEVLSGDRQEAVHRAAQTVGIERATGGASVAEKIEVVDARMREGKTVVYVGDGTNDAEAMSRAQVSIAPAKSTDEALCAAGLVALRGDLAKLPEVFRLGRKLAKIYRQNHFWAFAFNTLFIPIAALGKLVPLTAMLLMLMSSITVLMNSARLKQ